MNSYTVRVTVAITEEHTVEGVRLAPNSYLNYSTDYRIEGETLTDIAPHIDRLIAAMKAGPGDQV